MKNPFEGRKRLRLPGMHMITALETGMKFHEAFPPFVFAMIHDRYQHECLIVDLLCEGREQVKQAGREAATLEGATLGKIFSMMGETQLQMEEWSYLSDNDTYSISIVIGSAPEQVQRWICEGVMMPMIIPLGPLVIRPDWAAAEYSVPQSADAARRIQEMRSEIARNRAELEK